MRRLHPCVLGSLLLLLLAPVAAAESLSGSIAFSADEIEGTLHFTALAPGETSSGFAPFAGFSQTASADYTYLYLLENSSAAGTPTSFGNEHNFIDLDLLTLLDPQDPLLIYDLGFDDGNGGEAPSFIDTGGSPNDIDFQFDDGPNYGIVPEGGFSAFLLFRSPFAPSSGGGALVTNNTDPFDNFAEISSGVTTPVPEPGTAGLLAAGLLALAARRRA